MISSNFIFSFTNFLRFNQFSKSLVSVVLTLLTLLTNSLYSDFLTTSFFTKLLRLLKSTGVVSSFPIPTLSTLIFKLLKLSGAF